MNALGNDSGPASELDHQSSVGEDAEYEEQDANCISSIGDGYPVSPLPNFDHDSSPLSKKPRVDNSLGRVAAPVVHGMQSRRKNEANKVESDRGDDAMNASPLVHNGTSARSFAYRNYNSNGGSHSHTFLHYPYSHPMMTPSYFPPSSLCMGRMGPSLLAANPYFPYPVPSSPEHQRHPPSQDSNESQDPKVAPAQLSGDAATSVQNSEEGSQASSLAGWGSTSTDPCSLIQLQCTPIMAGAGLNRGMMMMPVSHPTGATLYTFGNAGVAAHCYPSSTLGMPLSLHVDTESLSEYQVLVRRQLELFSASVEDVDSSTQGRKKAVKPGQVGLRCRHCAALPLKARARGAVYYPSTLLSVYQAGQNMASSHLCHACAMIPPGLKHELVRLRERRDNAGGGKQYWADGCRAQGVVETDDGLRFQRPADGHKSP